jgi:hypothetical protein
LSRQDNNEPIRAHKPVASEAKEMVRLLAVLDPLRVAADVVVVPREYAAAWGDVPGTLIYDALAEGTCPRRNLTWEISLSDWRVRPRATRLLSRSSATIPMCQTQLNVCGSVFSAPLAALESSAFRSYR